MNIYKNFYVHEKTFKKIPTSRKMLHKERLDTKHPSLQRAWRRMETHKKELWKMQIHKNEHFNRSCQKRLMEFMP